MDLQKLQKKLEENGYEVFQGFNFLKTTNKFNQLVVVTNEVNYFGFISTNIEAPTTSVGFYSTTDVENAFKIIEETDFTK